MDPVSSREESPPPYQEMEMPSSDDEVSEETREEIYEKYLARRYYTADELRQYQLPPGSTDCTTQREIESVPWQADDVDADVQSAQLSLKVAKDLKKEYVQNKQFTELAFLEHEISCTETLIVDIKRYTDTVPGSVYYEFLLQLDSLLEKLEEDFVPRTRNTRAETC